MRSAKSWMNLPQRPSAELVYPPPSQGGAGLLSLADQHNIHRSARLSHVACERRRNQWAGSRSVEGDCNQEVEAAGGPNVILSTSAECAPHHTDSTVGEELLTIRVGVNARRDVAPRYILRHLRTHMVQFYATRLSAKADQGRGFQVVRRERVSDHLLRTGKFIRFGDWRFVHHDRLGILPLLSMPPGDGRPMATKDAVDADIASKRTAHVLSHCEPFHAARQRRHNNVQDRLVKAASNFPGLVHLGQPDRRTVVHLSPKMIKIHVLREFLR